MSKHSNAWLKAVGGLCLCTLLGAAGCGGDDDTGPGDGTGGTFFDGSGGASGTSGTPGSGGGPASGGTGVIGSGGTGGTTVVDSGTMCGTQSCADTCCEASCVDTDTDSEHCGACGTACDSDEECSAGICVPEARKCAEDGEDAGAPVSSDGCFKNEDCTDGLCRCGDGPGCAIGEDCTKDGTCKCGDGAACGAGSSCCDGKCIPTQADDENCGKCGNECDDDTMCVAGDCKCPTSGEKLCGGKCVDTQSDESNCGKCGEECGIGATCTAGKCVCSVAGREQCKDSRGRLRCVDLDTDANCGECGNNCEDPTSCVNPTGSRPLDCYCPILTDKLCAGDCTDTDADADNCGKCGKKCKGVEDTCRDGKCACPTVGETACDDDCVNLKNDKANCGKCGFTCPGSETCVAGECTCSGSPANNKYCDATVNSSGHDGNFACIAVTNNRNCGACDNTCIDGATCMKTGNNNVPADYVCVCPGQNNSFCPGVGCVNINNDEDNCGACGKECPSDATCRNRVCDCGPSNIVACADDDELFCVDIDTDPDNCGSCGNQCGNGQQCCERNCVDPDEAYDEDRQNCGSCGHTCPSTCGLFGFSNCACNNGKCATQ